MKKLQKVKTFLNEEHDGFAFQFEVLATLFMMTVFIVMTLYMLRVMNVQRYMNTVLTSTAATASRWGGVNTNAYLKNVSSTPLLTTSQHQLDIVAADYGAVITGSPSRITYDSQQITVTIYYHLPPVFSTSSRVQTIQGTNYNMRNGLNNLHMTVNVNSVMSSGRLL